MFNIPQTTADIIKPSGNKNNPEIAIVGGSPGAADVKERTPFSGAPGRVLQSLFFKKQIIWSTCYKTYVVKERTTDKLVTYKKSGVVTTEKFDQYCEMLKEELKSVNPNVVLAVGSHALYALTGEVGITNWRGSILESTLIPGLKVIPTLDPQSAIRQYLFQYYMFADVQRLKQECTSPTIVRPEYNYITNPTLEQSFAYLERCKKADLVGFDIEVTGFRHDLSEVSTISFSCDQKSAISITFTRGGKPRFSPASEAELWDVIAEILQNKKIRKVAQNRFFDGHFL